MAPKRGSNRLPAQSGPKPPQQPAVLSQELTFHQGPLPPPEQLAQYNLILPNAAERIITMAERQAEHRMFLEKRVVESDIQRANLGLAAGFIVSLVFAGVAAVAIQAGQATIGAAILGADLVALVGVFVYGTETRKREREDKAQLMAGKPSSRPPSSPGQSTRDSSGGRPSGRTRARA